MTIPSTPTLPDPTRPHAAIPRGAWLVLLAAFLGWMFDGLEQGIFPLIARPALQQMLGKKSPDIGAWIGYITAAWLVGAAVGGLLFGWLGDRLGRVRGMALSVLVYSAFTGLGYFAQQPWHLLVLRLLAALGMGGEWSLGVALVMECWPNNRRPILAGVIGISANLGFAITGVMGLIFQVSIDSWRWVMLLGLSPAVLTLLIRLFVPESEKWRHSVSTAQPNQPVREVMRPPLLSKAILGIALSSVALIGTWGAVQLSISPWVNKLAPDPRLHTSAKSLFLIAIGAIVGCFVSALLAEKLGRRITYFGMCLLSFAATKVLFGYFHTFGPGMMVMMFLVGALTASFFGWLPLYLPELFPTRVRATGQGIAYNTGRILAAGGAIWGGKLVDYYHEDYARSAAIITLVYLVGMIIIWFAPETRGKALPE
ncbi:MAG TPA: MFS transporter [Tepidisphaeraceae bacterium]|jgi:MFS family permease|nr:MFS transporter [Tepidisphaeraceae bacterium]